MRGRVGGIKICKDPLKAGIYANKMFKESNLCEIRPSHSVWGTARRGTMLLQNQLA